MGSSKKINNYPLNKRTVVLLGDSITELNKGISVDNRAGGYFTWLQALCGQSFSLINNAGVIGETSSQILARTDTDVISYSPTFCFVLCGMNDPTASSADTDLIESNITSIYNKLNANGIYAILLTMTPTASNSAKNAQALQVNKWMFKYFKDKENVQIVDVASELRDPLSATGALKANVSYDGIHPSNAGGFLMGKKLYDKLYNIIPSTQMFKPTSVFDNFATNTSSSNLWQYPLFTGTVTSGLHQNYTSIVLSNATYTPSVVASSDGVGNSQQFAITATAACSTLAGNLQLDFKCFQKPVIGTRVYAICEIEIDAGAVNFAVPVLEIQRDNSAELAFGMRNVTTQNAITIPSGGLKITLTTPVVAMDATPSSSVYGRLYFLFAGAGNATVRVSKFAIFVE
jgi:lysophospholipase L1-like esterase